MKVRALAVVVALFLLSSCVPVEVTQTINDIGEIVNESGLLVSAVDRLDSRVSPSDKVAALRLAEAASRASWLALSEANSKDSVSKKNEKIASYLSKVRMAHHGAISDLRLRENEDSLAGALLALREQLEANASVLFLHPEIGDLVPTSAPFTATRRLNQIRDKASETITTANLLLESLQ